MEAYGRGVLATTQSAPRRRRAERLLANLQPHLARLTREEAERRAAQFRYPAPPAADRARPLPSVRGAVWMDDAEFETVWNGEMGRQGKGLTHGGGGSSLAPGNLAGF